MTDTPLTDHYSEKKYEKISAGRREGIFELLGDCTGKRILDIGCANGALGKMLKGKFTCTIVGVEVSESAATLAREVLDQVYVFNIEQTEEWPAEILAGGFDAVIISEVLEHLFLPEVLMKRLRAIVHNKTAVILTVPNVLFWKNRMKILFGSFEYEERGIMDRGHIHFFSWKSLSALIEGEGFAIEATMHHVPTRILRWLADVFPGLCAHNFIVRIVVR